MSKIETPNEEQVFKQEVSDDELEAIAGGAIGEYDIDKHKSWCVKQL